MGMRVNEDVSVSCSAAEVWHVIADPHAVAELIPGAVLDREIDPRTFEGTISVRFGPRQVPISGVLKIEEWDEAAALIKLSGRGRDSKMSSRVLFSMTMQVEAADSDAGQATKLAMTLEASFTGPLDTIAKTGGQRIARSLVTQFGERLNEKLSGEVAAEPAPSRWSRFRLAVAAWLRHWGRGRRTSSDPAASGSAQGVSP